MSSGGEASAGDARDLRRFVGGGGVASPSSPPPRFEPSPSPPSPRALDVGDARWSERPPLEAPSAGGTLTRTRLRLTATPGRPAGLAADGIRTEDPPLARRTTLGALAGASVWAGCLAFSTGGGGKGSTRPFGLISTGAVPLLDGRPSLLPRRVYPVLPWSSPRYAGGSGMSSTSVMPYGAASDRLARPAEFLPLPPEVGLTPSNRVDVRPPRNIARAARASARSLGPELALGY